MNVLVWSIISINLIVFLLYGLDKYYAIKGHYRISERQLLFSAFLGPLGALMGIYIWRHKTRKWYFKTLAFFFLAIQLIIGYNLT